ncbi:dUTP diphosphatase [Bacillus bingmayongensis]|uniref:dUTP diphosphatase n=1 Tax=Bacillus bingmayongensis TaxID=1150157 RepID=UPI001C8EF07B|nr:dUTP diphosphatase [Bacillus bingmayongensis]MBY0597715.1 dUTP diphosphatase [Bacillus bingmayongensis]
MNLNKLFVMQGNFDNRVLTDKKLTREETFEFRILAFLDELGECMKEWRVFKFWSNDRKPRTFIRENCPDCAKKGYKRGNPPVDEKLGVHGLGNHWYYCEKCAGHLVVDKNPLLEEYVDGLHFAISLCIDLEVKMTFPASIKCDGATEQFFELYSLAVELKKDPSEDKADYLLAHYLGLGELLGFILKEIEQAYIEKNEVNHQRQDNGY